MAQRELREDDRGYLMGEPGEEFKVENTGDREEEVLLFDLDVE